MWYVGCIRWFQEVPLPNSRELLPLSCAFTDVHGAGCFVLEAAAVVIHCAAALIIH
ncbi:hypothetical protein BVRB_3g062730 [Beta vulgaris subsp. vulgaris]|nr:hypothetical protein BVRB_3g062730 [Beta vulgaris subsp. vulgaris]